jgi:DNA repair ATPase RecN
MGCVNEGKKAPVRKDMTLPRTLAFLMLLSSPAALAHSASAPSYRPAGYSARGSVDERELRQTRRELQDDRRDAERVRELLTRYDRARDHRDRRALAWLDSEVMRTMDREVREGERELQGARNEVQGARRELSRSTSGRRDDRRDLEDDRRDRERLQHELRQMRGLQREYAQLTHRMDGHAVWRKRSLLADFSDRARHELRSSVTELREDRRELREGGRRW